MDDHQHWLDRWKENRIGFHEPSVNRYLQAYLPRFNLDAGARIFLPLCGKALDMLWLAEQGYEVIGIELSEIALQAFFDENQLEYERIESDRLTIYQSGRIRLLQGDFFDLRRADLDDCALVYDRAALIAMSPSQRPRYYQHMRSIVPATAPMLLITLDYDQAEMAGPPYAVADAEVERGYGDSYALTLLEHNDILDERPRWRQVGLTALSESVFHLGR